MRHELRLPVHYGDCLVAQILGREMEPRPSARTVAAKRGWQTRRWKSSRAYEILSEGMGPIIRPGSFVKTGSDTYAKVGEGA